MLRQLRQIGACLCVAGCFGFAETQFSGVIAGAVFDPPTSAVRIVVGYPGAARIGSPVYSRADDAAIAPDGINAVALRDSRIVGLRQLDNSAIQAVEFGSSALSLNTAWAPDSKSAITWFANSDGSTSFQLWRVDTQPAMPVNVALRFDSLRCVQLLPGGDRALIAVKDGDNSGIYRAEGNGTVLRVARSEDPSAIAVDQDGTSVYFLDAHAGSIMRQRVDASQPPVPVIDGALAGVSGPFGLAVLNGRRLAVAGDTAIYIYGLDTGSLRNQIQLENAFDGFLRLGGSDWLILSHRHKPGDTLLLLDSRAEAVYFVPADGALP